MALSETTIQLTACAGLGALALAGGLVLFPKLAHPRPDPIQRAFAVGCYCILLWMACTVIGLFTAGAVFLAGPAYSVPTRLLGYCPLGVSLLVALALWISIQRDRAKARRKRRELRNDVPEYVIITDRSEEVMALYHAMRSLDGDMETNVFEHPQALRWQLEEHLPRMRVLAIKAWTKPRPGKEEEGLADTPVVLARDLAEEKPRCPIVLFGMDDGALDALEAILAKTWNVYRIRISGSDWIQRQWVPFMKDFLAGAEDAGRGQAV